MSKYIGTVDELMPGVYGIENRAFRGLDTYANGGTAGGFHPFGGFTARDIGKRVYQGSGVLTMENDEQLARRRKIEEARATGWKK